MNVSLVSTAGLPLARVGLSLQLKPSTFPLMRPLLTSGNILQAESCVNQASWLFWVVKKTKPSKSSFKGRVFVILNGTNFLQGLFSIDSNA